MTGPTHNAALPSPAPLRDGGPSSAPEFPDNSVADNNQDDEPGHVLTVDPSFYDVEGLCE